MMMCHVLKMLPIKNKQLGILILICLPKSCVVSAGSIYEIVVQSVSPRIIQLPPVSTVVTVMMKRLDT